MSVSQFAEADEMTTTDDNMVTTLRGASTKQSFKPARRPRFTEDYHHRFDRKAWDPSANGTGYLEVRCSVEVHDFGKTASGESMYAVNGVLCGGIHSRPRLLNSDVTKRYTSVDKLRADLPVLDNRPEWSTTRWIDVDGTNGDVIQYLLSLVSTLYFTLFHFTPLHFTLLFCTLLFCTSLFFTFIYFILPAF